MSIAATNQARMDQSIVIDRLAREFRHDAHRALAFEVNQGVQFTLHDGSVIHYRDQENRVARTQSIDGRPMASERFELGEGQLAAFGSPQPDQVRLTIQNTLPQPRLRRSIQAVVGRWAIPEANRGESR